MKAEVEVEVEVEVEAEEEEVEAVVEAVAARRSDQTSKRCLHRYVRPI